MKLLTLGAGNMAEAIVRALPADVQVVAVDRIGQAAQVPRAIRCAPR